MNTEASVASGHPLVTQTALDIMQQGGNAYDAVVAAGFMSALVEPVFTSLGGGGFLLARKHDGTSTVFDFFPKTPGIGLNQKELDPHFLPVTVKFPSSQQTFHIGHASVAVPGCLKGYLHIHKRLGTMPLKTLLLPTVKAAREGVITSDSQAHLFSILEPILTQTEASRALYCPAGRLLQTGDHYQRLDYAKFLEQLPKDMGESLYGGDMAKRIAKDMQAGGGLLTQADLAQFEVIERAPLTFTYGDHTLLTNPSPSFGGALIALGLQLLEQLCIQQVPWGSTEHLARLTGTMIEIENLRDSAGFSTKHVNDDWLTKTAKHIRTFSRGTTHISIIDPDGNAASMTTSNGEGSGYVIPGTGIMLNNMLGEDDLHPDGFHASAPGEKIASMMSPSILLNKQAVQLILGSGGSKRIRTAILQVISNVVDFGLSIENAVNAPRLHWDGSMVQIEPGYSTPAIDALSQHWPTNVWPALDLYFGGVHAVAPCAGGAGDPRRGGSYGKFSRKT